MLKNSNKYIYLYIYRMLKNSNKYIYLKNVGVCMCTCLRAYIMYVYLCIRMCTYVQVCVLLYTYLLYSHVFLCICMSSMFVQVCVRMCTCLCMYSKYEVLCYQQLSSSLYVSSAGSVCSLHSWVPIDVYWNLSKSNILKCRLWLRYSIGAINSSC